jgi:hypothetical protein
MYSVTITHTRPNTDTQWFWETDLADHVTYQAKLDSYYNGYITISERNVSDDGLTVTNINSAENSDIYYDCKKRGDADPELIKYWLERDNYNFDNNIFRYLQSLD